MIIMDANQKDSSSLESKLSTPVANQLDLKKAASEMDSLTEYQIGLFSADVPWNPTLF